MYTLNDKKYIDIELDEKTLETVQKIHEGSKKFLKSEKVLLPLEGSSLKIKIPFRYNRIMCKVFGSKTMYELKKGDLVEFIAEYTGVWSAGDYCGVAWKLNQVCQSTN
jgi:hypothetical protein